MPYSRRIDSASKIAYIRAHDPLDRDSSVNEMIALAAEPDFVAGVNVLVDLRGTTYVPTLDDVYLFADVQSRPEVFGGRRIAVVTESDMHVGLVNVMAGLMDLDNTEARTFRGVREAVSWLTYGEEPEITGVPMLG